MLRLAAQPGHKTKGQLYGVPTSENAGQGAPIRPDCSTTNGPPLLEHGLRAMLWRLCLTMDTRCLQAECCYPGGRGMQTCGQPPGTGGFGRAARQPADRPNHQHSFHGETVAVSPAQQQPCTKSCMLCSKPPVQQGWNSACTWCYLCGWGALYRRSTTAAYLQEHASTEWSRATPLQGVMVTDCVGGHGLA